MRRHRGILTLVSLLGLGAVSAAAVWWTLANRLPDPALADRRGLMRWMVQRDLAAETPVVRGQLIGRLEQELRGGVNLGEVDGAVDAAARKRFWANVDLLLRDWFSTEADHYAACQSQRQPDYVDRRISDVLSWKTVEMMRTRFQAKGQGGDQELLKACQQRVDRWIQQSEPKLAQKMRALAAAINGDFAGRSLSQSLQALFGTPKSDVAPIGR